MRAGGGSPRRRHVLGGAISWCLCSHLAGPEKLGISRSVSSGTPRRSSPQCRGSLPPHRSPAKPRASQEGSWRNLEGGSWLSERGPAESQRALQRDGRRWGEVPAWTLLMVSSQPASGPGGPRQRRPVLAQLTGADPSLSLWPFWGMGLSAPGIPAAPGQGHPTSAWWTWLDRVGTETPGAWGSRFPADLETVSDRCFSLTVPEELSWRSQEAGGSHLPTCPQDPEEPRVPPLGSRANSKC